MSHGGSAQDRRRQRRAEQRIRSEALAAAANEQAALADIEAIAADAQDSSFVTAEEREQFLYALSAYPVVVHAADDTEISLERWYRLRIEDEDFAQAWDEAIESGIGVLERVLWERLTSEVSTEEPTAEREALAAVEALAEDGDVFSADRSDRIGVLSDDGVESLVEAMTADVSLPAELQPVERTPAPNPSPAEPEAPPAAVADGIRWTAVLLPEGVLTEDGRVFAPGSVTWRDLPLSLMAMIETQDGHTGAQIAGRIDRIWREGNLVMGSGVFDDGEYGQEIARLVGDLTLRGLSVDVAPLEAEVGPKDDYFDEDGVWAEREQPESEPEGEPDSLLDILFGGQGEDSIYVVKKGVIGMATVCPFPAFGDAQVSLTSSGLVAFSHQAGFVLTLVKSPPGEPQAVVGQPGVAAEAIEEHAGFLTAAAAGMVPVQPPREWFETEEADELTPLVVTPDGHVYGHAAAWDTCHIGIPDVCTTAPRTNAQYAYFHLKEVECTDGDKVECGTITLETGHAARHLGRKEAEAHYDNTGMAIADVVAYDGEHGIWVSGALRPDADAEKVRDLRGAVLSGDWRNVNGNLELVALLAVNVPGFPVPRPRALVASGEGEESQVLALTAAGIHAGTSEEEALARIAALAERAAA